MSAGAEGFEDLLAALRRRYGAAARIENVVVPTLGGSNQTIVFDLVEPAGARRLVSRQETYVAENSPFLSPNRQFQVMRLAFEHGFPVPEPVFEYEPDDHMGAGFVTAFVAGETFPRTIIQSPEFAEVRPKLAAQCGGLFAHLHSLPLDKLDFLTAIPDSQDPLQAQRDRFDSYGDLRPAIEVGLNWLDRHKPPLRPKALLHGDFRNGNLMIGPDGVTAVLDWECCHLGSPAEDIGWLSTRSWRFSRPDLAVGGFGELALLLAAYEAAGGARIEAEEVRYWQVFGLMRWAVLNLMQAVGHVRGERRGLVYASCGRNVCLVEYDLLMTLGGLYV